MRLPLKTAALALALALLCARPPCFGAASIGGQDGGLLQVFDSAGNSISAMSLFDGQNTSLRITYIDGTGSLLWERTHSDGYQEHANALALDPRGGILLAGMRLWQGSRYFWMMKYSPSGDYLWERSDTTAPGCEASYAAANEAGEAWVAGSCVLSDGSYPARILHLDASGDTLWFQQIYNLGRNYVRGLSVDGLDRAMLALAVQGGALSSWGGMSMKTVMYDRSGTKLTSDMP
ncbi:MAG TPA: hypothetical protein DCM05_02265 [Elusimicrobia bacterium]|nr:hypothetical protein [Elusimicrobiota bacterium]